MRLLSLVLLSLPTVAAAQQQVTLRGKVEDVSGTANQFVVDCSNTALTSSTINLNAFVGQQVLLEGTQVGTAQLPHVVVTAITPVAEIFEIPGNPEVGDTLRFGVTYTPGTRVLFYASLGSGLVRFGRAGSFMLDPASAVLGASGVISQPGQLETSMALPNELTLVGRTAFAQALLRSGGQLLLSNPDCKTIR